MKMKLYLWILVFLLIILICILSNSLIQELFFKDYVFPTVVNVSGVLK